MRNRISIFMCLLIVAHSYDSRSGELWEAFKDRLFGRSHNLGASVSDALEHSKPQKVPSTEEPLAPEVSTLPLLEAEPDEIKDEELVYALCDLEGATLLKSEASGNRLSYAHSDTKSLSALLAGSVDRKEESGAYCFQAKEDFQSDAVLSSLRQFLASRVDSFEDPAHPQALAMLKLRRLLEREGVALSSKEIQKYVGSFLLSSKELGPEILLDVVPNYEGDSTVVLSRRAGKDKDGKFQYKRLCPTTPAAPGEGEFEDDLKHLVPIDPKGTTTANVPESDAAKVFEQRMKDYENHAVLERALHDTVWDFLPQAIPLRYGEDGSILNMKEYFDTEKILRTPQGQEIDQKRRDGVRDAIASNPAAYEKLRKARLAYEEALREFQEGPVRDQVDRVNEVYRKDVEKLQQNYASNPDALEQDLSTPESRHKVFKLPVVELLPPAKDSTGQEIDLSNPPTAPASGDYFRPE